MEHEIEVPNLSKLTERASGGKLDELDLNYVLLDSVDYKSDYLATVLLSKIPPGTKVKEDRKIYIKINTLSFFIVRIPELVNKT
jgi:beta-lactam-binding protein with PASTA domain